MVNSNKTEAYEALRDFLPRPDRNKIFAVQEFTDGSPKFNEFKTNKVSILFPKIYPKINSIKFEITITSDFGIVFNDPYFLDGQTRSYHIEDPDIYFDLDDWSLKSVTERELKLYFHNENRLSMGITIEKVDSLQEILFYVGNLDRKQRLTTLLTHYDPQVRDIVKTELLRRSENG